jgi:hypothetical protein
VYALLLAGWHFLRRLPEASTVTPLYPAAFVFIVTHFIRLRFRGNNQMEFLLLKALYTDAVYHFLKDILLNAEAFTKPKVW